MRFLEAVQTRLRSPAGRVARGLPRALAPVLVMAAMHAPALCYEPDSLSYCHDGEALYASFMIPVDAIREGELRNLVDERGLKIECGITIEVYEGRELAGNLVDMNPTKRRLEYDNWYQEYVVNKGMPDEYRTGSYIEALGRFRLFDHVKIVDLYLLEEDEPYSLSLEVEARIRAPVSSSSGGRHIEASVGAGVELVSNYLRGKDDSIFSIESERKGFTSGNLPSPMSPCAPSRPR